MDTTIIFFVGLLFAMIGIIPPGLLNISAAKISLKEGHARGVYFSIGACIIVIIQTSIAAFFAKYLTSHPEVIAILKKVALIIFTLIAVYYFFIAKEPSAKSFTPNIKSKHHRFFHGMLLSLLNVFPLPFQAYMVTTLATYGLLSFEKYEIITYISGVTMGSFVMLYIYMFFFEKLKDNAVVNPKNMNFIIGGVTALVSVFTLLSFFSD